MLQALCLLGKHNPTTLLDNVDTFGTFCKGLDMSDPKTTHSRTCIKCNLTFPTSHFRYRGTRAQALARGLSGNRLPWIESTICRDCRPKRRHISELSRKELANRVASGDLKQIDYDAEIARRKAQESRKKSIAMSMHHAMLKYPSLKPENIKLHLLEQSLRKEQQALIAETNRTTKLSQQLNNPIKNPFTVRKRGRPPKKLIPTL